MQDYYDILGVAKGATPDEIKRAYRTKARQLHPDYAGIESEEAFKELSVAYEVLSDPQKRRQYDLGGPGSFGGASGYPAGFGGGSFFNDIFETMFGTASGFSSGGTQSSRARRGEDVLVAVEVDLEEIVFGTHKDIRVNAAVTCDDCGGTCCAPDTYPTTCTRCNGRGQTTRLQQTMLGAVQMSSPCAACGGAGQTIPHPCPTCRGEGRTQAVRTHSVDIPAGVQNGARLRVRGDGEAGHGGGPAGDLYVEIREKPHPTFARQGDDLHVRIDVPMTMVALGTVFSLSTFDGDQELVIKPGTQPDATITLPGLGVGRTGRSGRGNLHVHIGVQIPEGLDARQRELLEEFAELREEHRVEPVGAGNGIFQRLRDKLGGQ